MSWHRPFLVLVALLVAGVSLATQVRRVNLEEMTVRAQRIVAGRCTAVETAHVPGVALPIRKVTLEVDRTIKGPPAATITLKTVAGVAGMPEFSVGEEVVLFLHGDSPRGLTSPLGLGQGAFTVLRDKQGRRVALNRAANRGLLDGLSPAARQRLGDRGAAAGSMRAPTPVELLDMVDALLELDSGARGAGGSAMGEGR